MKKCAYCGRENADDAPLCSECGTDLAAPPVETQPAQPRDSTWPEALGHILRYGATILTIALLYFLSFGPVRRYSTTVTIQNSTPVTYMNAAKAQTIMITHVTTVRSPHWVGVVYRPAFWLEFAGGENGLYARYLRWWNPPTQK